MSNSRADSPDLHGNVPDRAGAVLLLIDVINDLDFPDNKYLLTQAHALAKHIRELKERCRAAGIPAIYVNDNRGKWRSNVETVISECQRDGVPGRDFVAALLPDADDYIILKPKHSIFLATPLDLILEHLEAHTVVLAGVTTNSCVLVSAGEAFARGYRVFVPQDCVEALTPDAQTHSLEIMKASFLADTTTSPGLDLNACVRPLK